MVSLNPSSLAAALKRDEIVPYFQPIVELRTGKLAGFEVLARWQTSAGEILMPDVFIGLAEKSGLIGVLTHNLLRAAFSKVSQLPDHVSLSVNLSPVQFHNCRLPEKIERTAKEGGFSLDRLILEVTESALMEDIVEACAIAKRLKDLGVRLALDDFGMGYSSLRHLQGMPFDEIKVDASFVRCMDQTRESRKIAAAVIGLGHSLGLTTVAEGIETQAQAEMVLWLGCDFGQGWLYGRAAPVETAAEASVRDVLSIHDYPTKLVGGTMGTRMEALPMHRLSQLQAVYDGAPVGLCFIDREMRYMSVNKRLAEISEISVSDHIGRRISDLHPQLFPTFEPYIQKAFAGEASHGVEFKAIRRAADGSLRTLLFSYEPARDEADEIVGVSIAVVDISGRKRAEEALHESQDHYRHTIALNPQIPWTMDAEGMNVDISPRWHELTGSTWEQTRNRAWIDALHPEDVERARASLNASIQTGDAMDLEFRVRFLDGNWHWMRSRGSARRNAEGAVVRWYGSLEDIDDRKKMEQALVASGVLLKAVFDAVPVGIVIAEAPSGRILMSNPQAEAIFRRPVVWGEDGLGGPAAASSEAKGWPQEPMEPEDYPLVQAILSGASVGPEELLYTYPDGKDAWISATGAPVLNDLGQVLGGVVAVMDIDQSKREKQALMSRVAELQEEVAKLRRLTAPASRRKSTVSRSLRPIA